MDKILASVREITTMDVKGHDLSRDDMDALYHDPEEWKRELLILLSDVDQQFTERKAASIKDGSSEARKQYAYWRAKAVGYKKAICARLQEIKLMVKDKNIADSENRYASTNEILEEILVTVQSITGVLNGKKATLNNVLKG